MVDNTLGKAYEVVRTIYDNLDAVKAVGNNIGPVKEAANNIHRNIATITGTMGALEETVLVPITDGVTEASVFDSNVLLLGSDNALYSAGFETFSHRLYDGNLEVTLDAAAPSVLVGSDIRWTLSYRNNV